MFDAVVLSPSDPEPAARTFAGLVEGVVDGMVRRVTLVSADESDGLRKLADAAGCRLVNGAVPGVIGEWLKPILETPHILVLGAGLLLPPGWTDLLRHELQMRDTPAFPGGLAFRPATLSARLGLMASISARRPVSLMHGALVARSALTGRQFNGMKAPGGAGWRMADLTVRRMGTRPI